MSRCEIVMDNDAMFTADDFTHVLALLKRADEQEASFIYIENDDGVVDCALGIGHIVSVRQI